MEDRKQSFYEDLVKDGYTFGGKTDRQSFDAAMADPERARKLHGLLQESGDWKLDDFDDWYREFGPGQTSANADGTGAAGEAQGNGGVNVKAAMASTQPSMAAGDMSRMDPKYMMDENGQLPRYTPLESEKTLDEQGNTVWKPKMVTGKDGTSVYRDLQGNEYDPMAAETREMVERGTTEVSRGDAIRSANREQVAQMSEEIRGRLLQRGNELDAMQDDNNFAVGGGIARMPRYVTSNNGRQTDTQYRALQTAQLALNDAQAIISEADKARREGVEGFFTGAGRGFGEKLFDVRTWDMGMTDAVSVGTLLTALQKMESNQQITEEERLMLDAKAVEMATNAYFGSYLGRGYKAGEVTAESLPFMLEMCINPASATGETAQAMLTRYALKRFGKSALKNNAKKYVATKALARGAGDILGAATMSATTGMLRTEADAMQRMVGDIQFENDDNGESYYNGRVNQEEDFLTAFGKAFAATTIENYSEMVGEYLSPAAGLIGTAARKGLQKMGLGAVNDFIDNVAMSDVAKVVGDFEKSAKWSGTFGEFAEEQIGGMMNAILVGDQTMGEVWDMDNMIDTFLGVGLMGGFFSGVKTLGYRTPKYGARKSMTKADDDAAAVFGNQEEWGAIRNTIAFGTEQDMRDKLFEVATGDYTAAQKQAAFNYAAKAQEYKGVMTGEQKRRGEQFGTEQVDMEQSFDNGYTLEEPDEMNDAKNNYELQRQKATGALGEQLMTAMDDDPMGMLTIINQSGNYTDEEKKAAVDFVNAKATYDGMIEHVRDDIDGQVDASNREISMNEGRGDLRGKITPATMKMDDRYVYVIDGVVKMLDDGTMVDVAGSAESVLVRDAQTGKLEFVSPNDILNVEQSYDAELAREEAASAIREAVAQAAADKIDGKLPFQAGDVYSIVDEQGIKHEVKMLADNGDGTVTVEIDGVAQQDPMPKDVLQQMSDNEALQRLTAHEAETAAQNVDAGTQVDDAPAGEPLDTGAQQNAEGISAGEPDVDEDLTDEQLAVVKKVREATGNENWNFGDLADNEDNITYDTLVNSLTIVGKMEYEDAAEIADEIFPMPKKGKGDDAEPDFMAVLPDRGYRYLFNGESGLEEADADAFLANNLSMSEKEVEKIEKKEPKMGTSIAKFNKDKAEWQSKLDEAKKKRFYWREVNGYRSYELHLRNVKKQRAEEERKAAVRQQEEAARAEAEAAEAAYRAEQERLAAEQETRGANAVGKAVMDKWAAASKIDGATDEVVLANGEKITGHYVLAESGAASPSHDANNGFAKTEGFPVDENGKSVNDRDYERDTNAQAITRQIADKYDSRAMQTPVVVTKDGVVLSGNGRTMAGELAAAQGTDGEYVEYLKGHAAKYGFTAEQVEKMQHPRVLFVADEAQPYTAETFAKFNQQEMKGQSKTEQSVKLGKIVDDKTYGRIIQGINKYETLGEFYASKDALDAVSELQKAGAISQAQVAEMVDGDGISAIGREIIENMLVGKAFENNPDAIREISAYKGMRQTIITALGEITNNVKLGPDFSLEDELAAAIDLVYKARKEGGYKEGEKVSGFARQGNLGFYGDEVTVADFTNAMVMLWADIINDSRTTLLRTRLRDYNNKAFDSASGQQDIFEGLPSKEEILKDAVTIINNNNDNGTEQGQQAAGARQGNAEAVADGAGNGGQPGSGNVQQTDERQGNLGEAEEINPVELVKDRLSEQLDQNGSPFIVSSDGSIDFGNITSDKNLEEAPIRLSLGNVENGYIHIEKRHGDEIRENGFDSVLDFIEYVLNNYNIIRKGESYKNEQGGVNQTYYVQLTDKHNNTIFIQLSRDGSYWNINSAGVFSKKYGKKKETIWSASEVQNGSSATTGNALQSEPTADNGSTSNGTASNVSKDESLSDGSAIITPTTDAASANVSTLDAQNSGEQSGSASNQSKERPLSDSKDSDNNADGQTSVDENAQKVDSNAEKEGADGKNGADTGVPGVTAIGDGEYIVDGRTECVISSYTGASGEASYFVKMPMGMDKVALSVVKDAKDWGENGIMVFANSLDAMRNKLRKVFAAYDKQQTSTAAGPSANAEGTGAEPAAEPQGTVAEEAEPSMAAAIAAAEAETDTKPSEAQKDAGNYKKGHVKVDGYDITIENPKGSVRSGRDADGKEWSVTMNNTYGYIRGTEGVDGDHIDIFLSDNPEQGNVYVVDQVDADGNFDEHKVMYGFASMDEARDNYLANYSEGWKMGTITEVSKEEFKKWIESSHRKTKPFSEYKGVKKEGAQGEEPKSANSQQPKISAGVKEVTDADVERWLKEDRELRSVRNDGENVESFDDYMRRVSGVGSYDRLASRAYIYEVYGDNVPGAIEDAYPYVLTKDNAAEVARDLVEQQFEVDDCVAIFAGILKAKSEAILPFLDELGKIRKERRKQAGTAQPNMAENDNQQTPEQKSSTAAGENEKQKPRTRKPSTTTTGDEKIEDVGEKIGGARKDATLNYAKKIDLEATVPSKIFPKPNFASMEKAGVPHETLVKLKAYYTAFSITNKNKRKRNESQRILSARFYASVARDMLLRDVDVFNESAEGIVLTDYGKQHLELLMACVEALDKKGMEDFFDLDISDVDVNVGEFKEHEHGAYESKDGKRWVASYGRMSNMAVIGRKIFALDDLEGLAEEYCKQVEAAHSKSVQNEIRMHVYRISSGTFYISAKVKGIADEIKLKDGFATSKEAFDYIRENGDALRTEARAKADEMKQSKKNGGGTRKPTNDDIERMLRNIVQGTRIGKDYRNGKDVSADDFMKEFGFRGVEFGNWATQKERQDHLNACYDALMDLADLIGISPKAISLGGKLAMAFGSRGRSSALAHYEPAKHVINLTKEHGAGCVAHEWFHAVDNYFGGGVFGLRMKSAVEGNSRDNLRSEMQKILAEIGRALNGSDMKARSKKLGKGDYWASTLEMAARAFESYVNERLMERGQKNQYLSAHVPGEAVEYEALAKNDPYPTAEESKKFGEIFDRLFDTVQEEVGDDGNVNLFQIADVEPGTENVTEAQQLATEAIITALGENAGLDVVMETREEGRRVADGVTEADASGTVAVNNVRSVHSKDANIELSRLAELGDQKLKESLRWVENEKVQDWLFGVGLERPMPEDASPELVSVAKILNDFENPKLSGEIQPNTAEFMQVWHGSAAVFDHFDGAFMGTGEGSQAYGEGHYVTSVEGIARTYATIATENRQRSNEPIVRWKGQQVDFSSVNPLRLAHDVADSSRTIKEARERADRYADMAEEQDMKNNWKLALDILNQSTKADFKPVPVKGNRQLYEVEIPDDNGSNYLNWNEKIGKDVFDSLMERVNDYIDRSAMSDREKFNAKHHIDNDIDADRDYTVGEVVNALRSALVNGRLVSDLLSDMGYIGIKVQTNNLRSGDKSRFNYVVFKDSDLKISNRIDFMQRPEGTVYGWSEGNRIHLTTEGVNPNTPIHEYTHLWAKAVMQRNPKLWGRIKELLKGTPIWDEVVNDPAYQGLTTDDAIASEALSRLSGRKNAAKMEQMAQDLLDEAKGNGVMAEANAHNLVLRMKQALKDFWKWVGTNLFDMTDVRNIDEVTDRVLFDLLNKTDLQLDENGDIRYRGVTEFEENEVLDIEMQEYGTWTYSAGQYRIAAEEAMFSGRTWKVEGLSVAYPSKDALLNAFREKYPAYAARLTADENGIVVNSWRKILDEAREADRKRNEESAAQNGTAQRRSAGNGGRREVAKAAYESRKTRNAVAMIEEQAEKLGVKVEVKTDTEGLEGKQARVKGWYEKRTGRIVIVLPNHVDGADVMRTLLHEAVAHHGLRRMFGKDFDTFLYNVYANSHPAIRRRIAEMAAKHGWDFRTATEEYMAGLAEDIDYEHRNQSWWKMVRGFFGDLLRKVGIVLPVKLTDADLQLMLWKSWDDMVHKEEYGAFREARYELMKQRLGVKSDFDGSGRFRNGGEGAWRRSDGNGVAENAGNGEGRAAAADDGILYREGEEADEPLSLRESILQGLMTLADRNSENLQLRLDVIRALGGDLQKIRKAMRAQKEYDKSTVNDIVGLARLMMRNGYMGDMTAKEVERLMNIVRGATGKEEVASSARELVEMLVNCQMTSAQRMLMRLVHTRGSKLNAQGVEVQGELDAKGQMLIGAFRTAMDMTVEDIEERLDAVSDLMGSSDDAVAETSAIEYAALNLALQYHQDVVASKSEEKSLKLELKSAEEAKRNGKMDAKAYKEYVRSVHDAILQNKLERIEAIHGLVANISGSLRGSVEAAKDFREREKKRVEQIHHYANSDMQGRPADEHAKENWKQKVMNNPMLRFFLHPLGTWDKMLRMFGNKNVNGEGYLYNHYMRGWLRASETEYRNFKAACDELDEKASEVFGKKMRWSDLYSVERKMPKMEVKFWSDGEMKTHELTQGNMLYIYMVDKMADGQMKLRKMGITEEDVAAIKDRLDERFIKLADWLQEEFLVKKRNDYNAVHVRMFGANMAAIENYFPLKILSNARSENIDVSEVQNDKTMPSTTTGSIIKRRRNALALDVTGADAFSVVLEHVQKMENWAAFAELNRDINTLLSYKRFRNQVLNMSSIYGGGRTLWNNFRDVARIAAGTYHPAVGKNSVDSAFLNMAKGVTAAKISFRAYTALKQLLSSPAYLAEANWLYIAQSMAHPMKVWKWAMAELPTFSKRWNSKKAGDSRLLDTDMDWRFWHHRTVETLQRWGMTPNAFVDAITVSIGAHAIYKTKLARYKKDGYSAEDAKRKALEDAAVLVNESQQSNENAFLSTIQLDRTVATVSLSVFRNSSMGYQRQLVDAIRTLRRMKRKGYKAESIAFMAKQMERDGLTPEQAENAAKRAYGRAAFRSLVNVAMFGYIMQLAWNLGPYIPYLLAGDDDDEKDEMLKDAAVHALFGGIEGLTGGNIVSELANMKASGKSLRNYDFNQLPLISEIQTMFNDFEQDAVKGASDVVNLLIQMGVGVNPQSLTDMAVAIWDASGGDARTACEGTILAMRVLSVPQSQIDKIYLDEIGMKGSEARKLSVPELAERYAKYKKNRNAPLTQWAYGDEQEKAVEDKYIKKFEKMAKERLAKSGDKELDEKYAKYQEMASRMRKRLQEANRYKDDDPERYDAEMQELESTDEYNAYLTWKGYKRDIDNLNKMALEEHDMNMRDEYLQEATDTKRELVELLEEMQLNK